MAEKTKTQDEGNADDCFGKFRDMTTKECQA